jgi:heptaprenyl diphosphate synthase
MAVGDEEAQWIETAVRQVQLELELVLKRGLPLEIGAELTPLRGKFNRARLLLGFAFLGGEINAAALALASGVELLHLASLLQDDLVDRSEYRQGKRTFYVAWGVGAAVLLSDWLFGEAYRFLGRGGLTCVEQVNRMVKRMAWGELQQELKLQRGETLSVFGSLRYNYCKTALFFRNCCQFGFQVAKNNARQSYCAGKVGLWWGMAYQLGNDLQDLLAIKAMANVADEDRQRGLFTLPLLLLLRQKPELITVIRMIPQQDLLQLMQHTGIIEATLRIQQNWLSKARRYLLGLEPDPTRREVISRWLEQSEATIFPEDLAFSSHSAIHDPSLNLGPFLGLDCEVPPIPFQMNSLGMGDICRTTGDELKRF